MKYQNRAGTYIQLFLILIIVGVTGCASRTPVETVAEKPIDRETLKYKNIFFREFKAVPQVKSPSAAIQQCRDGACRPVYRPGGSQSGGHGRRRHFLGFGYPVRSRDDTGASVPE